MPLYSIGPPANRLTTFWIESLLVEVRRGKTILPLAGTRTVPLAWMTPETPVLNTTPAHSPS